MLDARERITDILEKHYISDMPLEDIADTILALELIQATRKEVGKHLKELKCPHKLPLMRRRKCDICVKLLAEALSQGKMPEEEGNEEH